MRDSWASSSSLAFLGPFLVVVVVVFIVEPGDSWLASKLSTRRPPPSSSPSSFSKSSGLSYSWSPPLAFHAMEEIAPEAQPPLSPSPISLPPSPSLALHDAAWSPLQSPVSPVSLETFSPSFSLPPSSNMGPFASQLTEPPENANVNREDNNRKRRFDKLSKVEASLARARTAIRKAAMYGNHTPIEDADYTPWGPIYRNPFKFHRSYIEMEKTFKIYVYKEGEPPLVHDGPSRSIYSTEGRFIHEMDKGNRFVTNDPEEAHAFFLPFSIVKMVHFIFIRQRRDAKPIKRFVADYIDVISKKYGYWERNRGADHFMVSCHDWGPMSSKASAYLYNNSIRVLCNANTSEGFNPAKDASLPEINMRTHDLTQKVVGGPSPSRRPILAFFAGGMHGPIRPALLEHWKGKDADVQVYEYLPKKLDYYDLMKKSRYCLCPSGYEVASPRIVEAIYLGCVPVILKEGYVLPFSDVLNWKSFSVTVPVSEIRNLKKILMGISTRRYLTMQRRVKLVRRHFLVNNPPKRYDIFHMILHSVWLRRLNQRPHIDFKNWTRF